MVNIAQPALAHFMAVVLACTLMPDLAQAEQPSTCGHREPAPQAL